jgi:ABC-type transport system involved in multi-copper enzyme maturation permease subunit
MPIFDQGYQHWHGALRGHGWRWLAVARHGIRAGMKNIFVRLFVILCWIPALMLAGVVCLWGLVEQKSPWAMALLRNLFPQEFLDNPAALRVTMWTLCFHFFIHVEMFFTMILVLLIGPGLISQDLRFNALPLYFARPVRRIDYFLGKLGTIGYFLALVTVVPAVAAWIFGVLFSLDFTVVYDTARLLLAVILYGVVVTLSAGLLMLALSSLTRNSRYVMMLWAGLWIFTNIVSGVLEAIQINTVIMRSAEMHMRDQQAFQRDQEEAMRDAQNPKMPAEERAARADARQKRAEARQRQMGHFGGPDPHEIAKLFHNDWRPCVSYTANLLRIGDALLGTYRAQDRWAAVQRRRAPQPPPNFAGAEPDDDLSDDEQLSMSPRWPWYWSGIILLALGGLSVWILNTRVKSLDRLR